MESGKTVTIEIHHGAKFMTLVTLTDHNLKWDHFEIAAKGNPTFDLYKLCEGPEGGNNPISQFISFFFHPTSQFSKPIPIFDF